MKEPIPLVLKEKIFQVVNHFDRQYYNTKYYADRFYKEIDPYLKYIILNNITGHKNLGKKAIKILDVGCGTGVYINFLRKEGFTVYGIDFSFSAVQISKQICASAVQIPFKNDAFDLLLSAHLIEHLTPAQMKELLSEFYRVIKTNGKIFLLTPNGWSPGKFILGKNWFRDPSHINIYTPGKLKKILKQNKFRNIKIIHKIPLNLQKGTNKRFTIPYYGLNRIFNRLPVLQDWLFFLATSTPLAYFRDVLYVSAEVEK